MNEIKTSDYKKDSITLFGAVGMGTGVMIGAAIFAVLGQVAELAGSLFPLSYIGGAVIAGLSSYAYIKMAHAYPSAGGIGMFFVKIYGKGTITASSSLLMAFSMIIAQSLVARTFGTYALQLFESKNETVLIPALGVGLLLFTFLINILNNRFIQGFTSFLSFVKILGLVIFCAVALWASDLTADNLKGDIPQDAFLGFFASLALSILAFKGFTTITNNGSEIRHPKKNISRAIIISITLCAVLYLFISFAVSLNLTIPQIIEAKDYSLAEAARPVLGRLGVWLTVILAIFATFTVSIGGLFAVSRMTTMLTDMKLIPHSHFGMKGTIHRHMLIFIIVLAITLTVFFDLTRIASLGAVFYLIMDIIFQWGVFRNKKNRITKKKFIIISSLIFDAAALCAFIWLKAYNDPLIIIISVLSISAIFLGEWLFLYNRKRKEA